MESIQRKRMMMNGLTFMFRDNAVICSERVRVGRRWKRAWKGGVMLWREEE